MAKTQTEAIYADSSFLISLYSPDAHSMSATRAMLLSPRGVLITNLVKLEVINALRQRVFWKQITDTEARRSLAAFEKNEADGAFRAAPLSAEAFGRAATIANRTTASLGTRSIDLLHVACALELGATSLYSFDERQRRLAHAMHLKLNPI
ncbi:MAG: type II toxin-antitoxin system VapC family toxin [Acidobacteriota bacterium]